MTGFPETEKWMQWIPVSPTFCLEMHSRSHCTRAVTGRARGNCRTELQKRDCCTENESGFGSLLYWGVCAHSVHYTSLGRKMIRGLQPEHCHCSCTLSSDGPEWQVLGSHPGHLLENPEESNCLWSGHSSPTHPTKAKKRPVRGQLIHR